MGLFSFAFVFFLSFWLQPATLFANDLTKDAFLGNLEQIRSALNNGVDPNSVDEDGNTMLHHLAHCFDGNIFVRSGEQKFAESIRLLLEHKANPNAVNRNGNTPLKIAAQYCTSRAAIEELIKGGAKVNGIDRRYPPLTIAFDESNRVAIDTLLDNGAFPTVSDAPGRNYGREGLRWALFHKDLELFRRLVGLGDDIHRPMYDFPVPPLWSNNDAVTILQIAVATRQKAFVEFLINSGADKNVRFKDIDNYNYSDIDADLLQLSLMGREPVDLELVKYLIQLGFNPATKNERGKSKAYPTSYDSPLSYALEKHPNNLELIALLKGSLK